MKKIVALLLTASMAFAMVACNNSQNESATPAPTANTSVASPETQASPSEETKTPDPTPSTVKVYTLNENKEKVEIEVPFDPQRVAVMDLAVLDMLDKWQLTDRVVGMAKNTYLDYLGTYFNDDAIANLGTLHESDLEAMMAAQPEIIFIGGRMAKQYAALSEIAPVIYMGTDYSIGLVQSVKNNATNLAQIFGIESLAQEQLAGFDARVDALAKAATGKTAVIGVVTSGGFNTLGNSSRCSLIGGEVGFDNLAADVDSTHGNESSFELLVEKNPDYIFVLDRDAAIAEEGAKLAQEVMENELVEKTNAHQNNHIVYLTPAPWYLAEGGLTSMDIMLSDLEGALLQ